MQNTWVKSHLVQKLLSSQRLPVLKMWGPVRYKCRAGALAFTPNVGPIRFHFSLFIDALVWVSYKILWELRNSKSWGPTRPNSLDTPTSCPMSGQTHTHTGPTAVPRPQKWSVRTDKSSGNTLQGYSDLRSAALWLARANGTAAHYEAIQCPR